MKSLHLQGQRVQGQHDRRRSVLAEGGGGREEIKGVCSLWEGEKQKDLLKTAAWWQPAG